MKLKAEVDDNLFEVEITKADGKVTADVDGRRYIVDVSEPEPNITLLKTSGRVYEAFVSPRRDMAAPFDVRIGTYETLVRIVDPKRMRSSAGAGAQADGVAEIRTAMPGKVVRILKSTGDPVETGEGVIVVEAMKMQNEMRSPKDGIIKEIKVTEGSNVGAGDLLVMIE